MHATVNGPVRVMNALVFRIHSALLHLVSCFAAAPEVAVVALPAAEADALPDALAVALPGALAGVLPGAEAVLGGEAIFGAILRAPSEQPTVNGGGACSGPSSFLSP